MTTRPTINRDGVVLIAIILASSLLMVWLFCLAVAWMRGAS